MCSFPQISLCRLCLCSGGTLIDIFKENDKVDFVVQDVIEDLLHIQVKRLEGFPWCVCSTCLNKLIEFRFFKMRCLECKVTFESRYPEWRNNILMFMESDVTQLLSMPRWCEEPTCSVEPIADAPKESSAVLTQDGGATFVEKFLDANLPPAVPARYCPGPARSKPGPVEGSKGRKRRSRKGEVAGKGRCTCIGGTRVNGPNVSCECCDKNTEEVSESDGDDEVWLAGPQRKRAALQRWYWELERIRSKSGQAKDNTVNSMAVLQPSEEDSQPQTTECDPLAEGEWFGGMPKIVNVSCSAVPVPKGRAAKVGVPFQGMGEHSTTVSGTTAIRDSNGKLRMVMRKVVVGKDKTVVPRVAPMSGGLSSGNSEDHKTGKALEKGTNSSSVNAERKYISRFNQKDRTGTIAPVTDISAIDGVQRVDPVSADVQTKTAKGSDKGTPRGPRNMSVKPLVDMVREPGKDLSYMGSKALPNILRKSPYPVRNKGWAGNLRGGNKDPSPPLPWSEGKRISVRKDISEDKGRVDSVSKKQDTSVFVKSEEGRKGIPKESSAAVEPDAACGSATSAIPGRAAGRNKFQSVPCEAVVRTQNSNETYTGMVDHRVVNGSKSVGPEENLEHPVALIKSMKLPSTSGIKEEGATLLRVVVEGEMAQDVENEERWSNKTEAMRPTRYNDEKFRRLYSETFPREAENGAVKKGDMFKAPVTDGSTPLLLEDGIGSGSSAISNQEFINESNSSSFELWGDDMCTVEDDKTVEQGQAGEETKLEGSVMSDETSGKEESCQNNVSSAEQHEDNSDASTGPVDEKQCKRNEVLSRNKSGRFCQKSRCYTRFRKAVVEASVDGDK